MHITLIDRCTMRLSFAYNATTKDFVKALGAQYEGDAQRTWTLSVRHLRTVVDAYPSAQVEQAVIDARYAMWKRLIRTLSGWGIEFAYTPNGTLTVYPHGDATPQAMLDFIAAHTAQLAPWLAESIVEPQKPAHRTIAECPQNSASGATLNGSAKGDGLILRGIKNAYERSVKIEGMRKRQVAKRYQKKRLELAL